MVAFLPVSFCHCALMASSAFFKLAAAKTTNSPLCAWIGVCGSAQASNTAAARRSVLPSRLHLQTSISVLLVLLVRCAPPEINTIQRYILYNIAKTRDRRE